MPDFLSKEEIRKWRSSLERITLEEYAARLGKVIQEERHDDSLVDSVILKSLNSMTSEKYMPGTEKIRTLSLKSFSKEKEIKEKKETPVKKEIKEETAIKEVKQTTEVKVSVKEKTAVISEKSTNIKQKEAAKTKEIKETVNALKETKPAVKREKVEKPVAKVSEEAVSDGSYSFQKPLTAREQLVFDHFIENKNTIVYAADLAKILDLPRDYVYKYIKNLRSKLNEDILQNAENGGYLLKV